MALFIVVFGIVALDQIVKFLTTSNLSVGESVPVLQGVFHFTYVQNTGAAFGILKDQKWLFIIITSIVLAIALFAILKKYVKTGFGRVSLYMIMGGAIGNLIDRIAFGYVVDMLEIKLINFAIFNIADIFVAIGGVLFCIYLFFQHDKAVSEEQGLSGVSTVSKKLINAPKPQKAVKSKASNPKKSDAPSEPAPVKEPVVPTTTVSTKSYGGKLDPEDRLAKEAYDIIMLEKAKYIESRKSLAKLKGFEIDDEGVEIVSASNIQDRSSEAGIVAKPKGGSNDLEGLDAPTLDSFDGGFDFQMDSTSSDNTNIVETASPKNEDVVSETTMDAEPEMDLGLSLDGDFGGMGDLGLSSDIAEEPKDDSIGALDLDDDMMDLTSMFDSDSDAPSEVKKEETIVEPNKEPVLDLEEEEDFIDLTAMFDSEPKENSTSSSDIISSNDSTSSSDSASSEENDDVFNSTGLSDTLDLGLSDLESMIESKDTIEEDLPQSLNDMKVEDDINIDDIFSGDISGELVSVTEGEGAELENKLKSTLDTLEDGISLDFDLDLDLDLNSKLEDEVVVDLGLSSSDDINLDEIGSMDTIGDLFDDESAKKPKTSGTKKRGTSTTKKSDSVKSSSDEKAKKKPPAKKKPETKVED